MIRSSFILLAVVAISLAGRMANAQDKKDEKHLTQDQAIDLADRILDEDDEVDAEKALAELKAKGDDGIWDMLEAAKDLAIEDQGVLAEAIAQLGKDALPELLATIGDEDDDVRQTVLFALEELGTDALPGLAKIMKEGTEEQRAQAAVLFEKLDEDAVPTLIGFVRDGPPEARGLAASVLAEIGGPSIQPLAAILPSNKPARDVSFGVLMKIGEESVAAASSVTLAMQDLLKSSHPDVRECAALLVGKFGGADAMPKVLDALCSPDEKVRDSAAMCASIIGEPAVPDLLHCLNSSDKKIVEAAADALAAIGEPAVPKVTKLLKAPVVQVRGNCACVLGRMKRRASIPDLVPLFDDEDKNVRMVVKSAIAQITGEKIETKEAALAWFEKHKDDPENKAAPQPR